MARAMLVGVLWKYNICRTPCQVNSLITPSCSCLDCAMAVSSVPPSFYVYTVAPVGCCARLFMFSLVHMHHLCTCFLNCVVKSRVQEGDPFNCLRIHCNAQFVRLALQSLPAARRTSTAAWHFTGSGLSMPVGGQWSSSLLLLRLN